MIQLSKNAFLLFLISVIPACQELPNEPDAPYNPLDPNNPDYRYPAVTITSGPDSNQIVSTDGVSFSWTGNLEAMDYRTKIDDAGWTTYSQNTSIAYSNLDEFGHIFYIQGRYQSGVQGDIKEVPFIVDAIDGPALFTYPRDLQVNQGIGFIIDLMVDEADSMAALSSRISFNPQFLQVVSINFLESGNESFLLENNGQLITFHEINNDSGFIQIDLAVVEANPRNVSGSGKIAEITFLHISGQSSIRLSDESLIRKSNNDPVPLNYLAGSMIRL